MPKLSHLILIVSGFLLANCGIQPELVTPYEMPPVAGDTLSVRQAGRIDGFLHSLSPQTFNGAVVLEKGGKLISGNGYGYALNGEKLPFTTKTVTNTAHLARQFTAAAILKLKEKQLLQLTDSLPKFLDELPQDKKDIQLIHLLQNTSGLPREFPDPENYRSKDDFLEATIRLPLLSDPGEAYQYSEVGYRLLAAVVEEASGLDYETFIRQEFLAPAGMYHTGYVLPDFSLVPHAKNGEAPEEEEVLYLQYKENAQFLWHIMGSQGLLSNSEDIFRWMQLLFNGSLLPADAMEYVWGVTAALEGNRSAFGWVETSGPGKGSVLLHQSEDDGFFVQLSFLPQENASLVLLANQVNGQVKNLGEQLLKVVTFPNYVPAPLPYTEQKLVRLPQEKEALHVRSLLQYIQEGNKQVAHKLIDQHYSFGFRTQLTKQEHLEALAMLAKQLHDSMLEKAEESMPFFLFTFSSPSGLWYQLRVQTEPQEGSQIKSISLETTDAMN